MTLDLKAIEARCKAVSRLPWHEWTHSDGTYRVYGGGSWGVAEMTNPDAASRESDMKFIAHAHEDIPALLAEIKQLRRHFHDERVQRNKWEKMYNQAIRK